MFAWAGSRLGVFVHRPTLWGVNGSTQGAWFVLRPLKGKLAPLSLRDRGQPIVSVLLACRSVRPFTPSTNAPYRSTPTVNMNTRCDDNTPERGAFFLSSPSGHPTHVGIVPRVMVTGLADPDRYFFDPAKYRSRRFSPTE